MFHIVFETHPTTNLLVSMESPFSAQSNDSTNIILWNHHNRQFRLEKGHTASFSLVKFGCDRCDNLIGYDVAMALLPINLDP